MIFPWISQHLIGIIDQIPDRELTRTGTRLSLTCNALGSLFIYTSLPSGYTASLEVSDEPMTPKCG